MTTIAVENDLELLKRYRSEHDESAFAELVRRYAGMVYAACYRVLNDRELAQETAQETFLRLLRTPQRVSTSVGGWLHHAATQLAIDVARSESARRRREAVHAQTEASLLDDSRSWSEISANIDLAMTELPEDSRDLLVQHFIFGRSQTEIANERGISVATICRRVNGALDRLRAILQRHNVSLSAAVLAADFLALHGTHEIPPALAQSLGKMSMIAGVRRSWHMARTTGHGAHWETRQVELAAGVLATAVLVLLVLLALLGKSKSPPQIIEPPAAGVAK